MNHILKFDGYAANGAFQLMNPLTRLASGEIIGRDFQFFHGAGVALIHYPLFAIFGQGLFGSEMSRWFTSIILFIITGIAFCQLWFGSLRSLPHPKSVISFIFAFTLTMSLSDAVTPSNSLLGIRTTLPLLIGAVYLYRHSFIKRSAHIGHYSLDIFAILVGISLSAAVICGTEHGIAAAIAYLLTELFIHLRQQNGGPPKQRLISYLATVLPTLCILLISLLIFASIISLGSPWQLLKYNLVTVPMEQFWYFGADPQGFLQLSSLTKQLIDPTMIALYLLVTVTVGMVVAAKKYRILSGRHEYTIFFLFTYGLLTLGSLLGYFTPAGQVVGIFRMLLIVDSLIIVAILSKLLNSSRLVLTHAAATILVVACTQITLLHLNIINYYPVASIVKETYRNMRGDHDTLLGDRWQSRIAQFKPYIEAAKKQNPESPLWSTYSSLYEQGSSIIHPSSAGCDYIIHCLGNEMQSKYTADFIHDKPTLVVTLRPAYFGFEEWLWGRQADFYKHLVENYEIITSNDAHILWKIKDRGWANSRTPKALTPISNSIELPSTSTTGSQIIEVGVKYNTDKIWSTLPGVNKIPRYLGHLEGTHSTIAVSLPPHKNEWKFLIVLNKNPNIQQRISFSADGLLPASMKIISANYTPINLGEKELDYFTEKSAFSITH